MTSPNLNEDEIEAYCRGEEDGRRKGYAEGYCKALREFAWWKDGVEYVGCGVWTLSRALKEFHESQT